MQELTASLAMGIAATLATDLWVRVVHVLVGLPLANWAMVGRWVAGFPRGAFVHRPIAATAPVPGELAIGWVFHYVVGVALAALYLAITRLLGSGPTFVSALLFGVVTVAAPWFVMQPALGLGFMASRAPKPGAVRAVNMSVHTVFGGGLYIGAIIAQLIGAL